MVVEYDGGRCQGIENQYKIIEIIQIIMDQWPAAAAAAATFTSTTM